MTHAQITITRGDAEILVNVTGNYIPPLPAYNEFDDIEDITCTGLEGGEIFLASEEESRAFTALLETARQERESALVDAQIDEMRDEP